MSNANIHAALMMLGKFVIQFFAILSWPAYPQLQMKNGDDYSHLWSQEAVPQELSLPPNFLTY